MAYYSAVLSCACYHQRPSLEGAGEAATVPFGTDPAAVADEATVPLLYHQVLQVQVHLCLDLLDQDLPVRPSCSVEACPCQEDRADLGRTQVHHDRPSSCWAPLLFLVDLQVDPWAVQAVLTVLVGSCPCCQAALCLPVLVRLYRRRRRPVLPSLAGLPVQLVLVRSSSRLSLVRLVLARLVHGRASSAAVGRLFQEADLGRAVDRLGRPSSADLGRLLLGRGDTVWADHCSSFARASWLLADRLWILASSCLGWFESAAPKYKRQWRE